MNRDQLLALARVRALVQTGKARERRLRARLSLSEVASTVGVSPVTILRWERQERSPRGPQALRYEKLLRLFEGDAAAAEGRSGEGAAAQ